MVEQEPTSKKHVEHISQEEMRRQVIDETDEKLLVLAQENKEDKEKRNPKLDFDKVEKTGKDLEKKFTDAKENSASVEIDAAIDDKTKMIFVGEMHLGNRMYYMQLIDKYILPKKGVIFLEGDKIAQQKLNEYMADKATFEDVSKAANVNNWKHVIEYAKAKKLPVVLVDDRGTEDEPKDRDQAMALNTFKYTKNNKPERGILFVGDMHLISHYGENNRKNESIPERMAKLGSDPESMVDVIFHPNLGDDAITSKASMESLEALWTISHKKHASKGITLSANDDYLSYANQWIDRLKNPATRKTIHAIVDRDAKLKGKDW